MTTQQLINQLKTEMYDSMRTRLPVEDDQHVTEVILGPLAEVIDLDSRRPAAAPNLGKRALGLAEIIYAAN